MSYWGYKYEKNITKYIPKHKQPKSPGHDVICNKCGYPHKQIFASHKVITCPACGQNPIGV